MGLPYSYSSFFETDFSPQNFFIKLKNFQKSQKFYDLSFADNKMSFDYNSGLFGLKTNVSIDFKTDNSGFYYEFSLISLIKIIIVLIIVFAFVLKGIRSLIIIPSVTIFVMYLISVFHIKNHLVDVFEEITKERLKPETLSEEQKRWMDNPDLCPACGTELIVYDKFCPECGLSLSAHRKSAKDPSSRTGFEDYRIIYEYYQPKK
ncbi:MAG: hypothetical protein JXL97_12970 [Bacteroidales bacterium]|nr:hypothetical protein [Bacteroidales bacterium]